MNSNATSTVAAQIFQALKTDDRFRTPWITDNEPFRAVVDVARDLGWHTIEDGSEAYCDLVDCLEYMLNL